MPTVYENSPKYSETCSVYRATDDCTGPCLRVFLYDEKASFKYDITIIPRPAVEHGKFDPAGRLMVTPPSLSSLPVNRFPALRIPDRTARHPAPRRRPSQWPPHGAARPYRSRRPAFARPAPILSLSSRAAEAADHWTKRFSKYRPALFGLGGAIVQNLSDSANHQAALQHRLKLPGPRFLAARWSRLRRAWRTIHFNHRSVIQRSRSAPARSVRALRQAF